MHHLKTWANLKVKDIDQELLDRLSLRVDREDFQGKCEVWKIREREYNCCGQKIQYSLVKEHVVHLSVPKIYEILAEKYVLRSKWKKNKPRDPIPQAVKPRQVIQMATIH